MKREIGKLVLPGITYTDINGHRKANKRVAGANLTLGKQKC